MEDETSTVAPPPLDIKAKAASMRAASNKGGELATKEIVDTLFPLARRIKVQKTKGGKCTRKLVGFGCAQRGNCAFLIEKNIQRMVCR